VVWKVLLVPQDNPTITLILGGLNIFSSGTPD
jgi:hypothetical protein